jgi:arabinose-5-phosphate isomerase
MEITGKKLGLTLVLNKKKIVGVFTDGDLRRCLNDGVDINNTPSRM